MKVKRSDVRALLLLTVVLTPACGCTDNWAVETSSGATSVPLLVGQTVDVRIASYSTYVGGATCEITEIESTQWQSTYPAVATVTSDQGADVARVAAVAAGTTQIEADVKRKNGKTDHTMFQLEVTVR